MKKIIALVLVSTLAFGLVGCSGVSANLGGCKVISSPNGDTMVCP